MQHRPLARCPKACCKPAGREHPAVTAVEAQSSETDVDLGYNIGEHDVTWLVLFGVTDDFTARYADLADDGLRSAQSTAPALYAVTNVDGRIYLTAK